MHDVTNPEMEDSTPINALLKTAVKDIITLTRYLYTHPGGIYIANNAAQKIKKFLLTSRWNNCILGIFTTGFPNYALDWTIKGGDVTLALEQSSDIYINN